MKPGQHLNPFKPAPTWDPETVLARVLSSKTFLSVHGFLSEGERDAVNRRIEKWVAGHLANGTK